MIHRTQSVATISECIYNTSPKHSHKVTSQPPNEVHAEVPPGVPVMKDRKDKISYRFESIPNGGKLLISTDDPKALKAVHEYLRYQIREHKTGDPLDLQ